MRAELLSAHGPRDYLDQLTLLWYGYRAPLRLEPCGQHFLEDVIVALVDLDLELLSLVQLPARVKVQVGPRVLAQVLHRQVHYAPGHTSFQLRHKVGVLSGGRL